MLSGSRSLMDFVDAPLLVGDPDGRVVYVNPAFERDFGRARAAVSGQPLALVFEGGGREAILAAVARVCDGDSRVRFKMREAGRGFAALASPVEVEEGRVGVIVLLTLEGSDDRLVGFQHQVREPLDEIASCLLALSSEAKQVPEEWGILVAEALRALGRIRKWAEGVDVDRP